jgi:hypothetical protein
MQLYVLDADETDIANLISAGYDVSVFPYDRPQFTGDEHCPSPQSPDGRHRGLWNNFGLRCWHCSAQLTRPIWGAVSQMNWDRPGGRDDLLAELETTLGRPFSCIRDAIAFAAEEQERQS